MKITNKVAMYRRLRAGEFGNTLRTWPTLRAVQESGYVGPLSLRFLRNGRSSHCTPLAQSELAHVSTAGALLCEPSPVEFLRVQGELCEHAAAGDRHPLRLYYSTIRDHMHPALKAGGRYAVGLQASAVLRQHLDDQDREQLLDLLRDHPGAVVEFSAFSRPCGALHRPIVIWEVRNY